MTVRFTVDRDGEVSRITLVRSSGVPELDEETIALLGRASPLPPPPPEAGDGPFELVAPVLFRLRVAWVREIVDRDPVDRFVRSVDHPGGGDAR